MAGMPHIRNSILTSNPEAVRDFHTHQSHAYERYNYQRVGPREIEQMGRDLQNILDTSTSHADVSMASPSRSDGASAMSPLPSPSPRPPLPPPQPVPTKPPKMRTPPPPPAAAPAPAPAAAPAAAISFRYDASGNLKCQIKTNIVAGTSKVMKKDQLQGVVQQPPQRQLRRYDPMPNADKGGTFECEQVLCDYKAPTKRALAVHRTNVHGNKKPCPYCGNMITSSNMARHIKTSCKKAPKNAK